MTSAKGISRDGKKCGTSKKKKKKKAKSKATFSSDREELEDQLERCRAGSAQCFSDIERARAAAAKENDSAALVRCDRFFTEKAEQIEILLEKMQKPTLTGKGRAASITSFVENFGGEPRGA